MGTDTAAASPGILRRILGTLVLFPIPGASLVALGRWRRALVWCLAFFSTLLSVPFVGMPGLLVSFAVPLAAAVDALLVKPAAKLPGWGRVVLTWLGFYLGVVAVAIGIRVMVLEAFKIPSGAMIPTIVVGDHIFVNKFVHRLHPPARGDVIVFAYPIRPSEDFIKRVVGVAGDSVEVKQNVLLLNGRPVASRPIPGTFEYWDFDEDLERWVVRSSVRIDEELDGTTYGTVVGLAAGTSDFPRPDKSCEAIRMLPDPANPHACIVPPRSVFVMGDNRSNSHDSRFWGPVPLENVKGKATMVWWSAGGPEGVRWARLGKRLD